jgi:hypothetical protein
VGFPNGFGHAFEHGDRIRFAFYNFLNSLRQVDQPPGQATLVTDEMVHRYGAEAF